MKKLISQAEAHAAIDLHLLPFPAIACPIEKCAGRILRQPICADRPFPPFDRAMMDGYALRADDLQTGDTLQIIGRIDAGSQPPPIDFIPHSCLEIMTGAVVPDYVDCIVPVEETEKLTERAIRLCQPDTIRRGDYIHPCGSDETAGTQLLAPGNRLGSREIALAATCGHTHIEVSKKPSLCLIGTGDELVEISQTPQPHQIRRSNTAALQAALARNHIPAGNQVHLPDELDGTLHMLDRLIGQNDVVLITGGISMGRKDFIPEALDSLGCQNHFHGVRQKPGKPFGFWSRNGCAVFALPGNPVSALVCLHHFVLPALGKAAGRTGTDLPTLVTLTSAAEAHPYLHRFLPVQRLPGNRACAKPFQNSGDMIRLLESDGYVVLPPDIKNSDATGTEFAFNTWY